ncbi:hypothetical protein FH972_013035 [Carpinus fangiana]|uniref:Uncharacterized protein n=1 Tax=Carpinus fangiana TaxID=176857 RepID=A0A5N6R8V4_9ROSI|nr:hypothetical protein FH972_013035 [Carpinus fangiana]
MDNGSTVPAVRDDTEREAFGEVGDTPNSEMGFEQGLRVELLETGRVELGDEREPRESHCGRVEVANASTFADASTIIVHSLPCLLTATAVFNGFQASSNSHPPPPMS